MELWCTSASQLELHQTLHVIYQSNSHSLAVRLKYSEFPSLQLPVNLPACFLSPASNPASTCRLPWLELRYLVITTQDHVNTCVMRSDPKVQPCSAAAAPTERMRSQDKGGGTGAGGAQWLGEQGKTDWIQVKRRVEAAANRKLNKMRQMKETYFKIKQDGAELQFKTAWTRSPNQENWNQTRSSRSDTRTCTFKLFLGSLRETSRVVFGKSPPCVILSNNQTVSCLLWLRYNPTTRFLWSWLRAGDMSDTAASKSNNIIQSRIYSI